MTQGDTLEVWWDL